MDPAVVFAVCLGLFWGALNLLRVLLPLRLTLFDLEIGFQQKLSPYWSQRIRQQRLVLAISSIGIETEIFTPYIVGFATRWKKLVHLWFLLGAVVGVACLIVTMLYLLPSYLWTRFMTSTPPAVEVQLIIPGVTLPWTYVPHVMIAIFLTLAFHELGHALSGANDNKAIESIGLVIQLFVPTAYVRFREHHYDLTPWRQLKVYCAGAWHNFVLYGLAALILTNSALVLSPLYVTPTDGQTITRIKFYAETTSLHQGDRVIGLNHCDISTLSDWSQCLSQLSENSTSSPQRPACVPLSWVSESDLECCGESYKGPVPCWRDVNSGASFCRPAREVWAQGVSYCSNVDFSYACPADVSKRCAVPQIQERFEKMGVKLLQLRVKRGDELLLVHSLQHPYELLQQLEFETFVPRWSWMPSITRNWADHFMTLCSLLANFNLITPIVSLLPIYAFDGEYALYALTMWLAPDLDDGPRETIIAWIRNGTSAAGILVLAQSLFKTFF